MAQECMRPGENWAVLDELADTGELIVEWARSEACTFPLRKTEVPLQTGGQVQTVQRPPARLRGLCVQGFRVLLANHNALSELGAALTLLDGLTVQQANLSTDGHVSYEELADVTNQAAIVRIVLKCSSNSLTQFLPFSTVEQRVGIGEREEDITQRELQIIRIMECRVAQPSLPTPSQWVALVLQRVEALLAMSRVEGKGLQPAFQSVHSVTELLVEQIGMTAEFPPRTLAVGACVLGLVTAGVLPLEDVRPKDVTFEQWESSLLVRQSRLAPEGGAGDNLHLDGNTLAQAACCNLDDLRFWAFQTAQTLQEIF